MYEVALHIQTPLDTEALVSRREGEVKLGQRIQHCTQLEDVMTSDARYVIFGIEEDIGVIANYGKPGTRNAWKSFLKAFVNVQDNAFNDGASILLLGHIKVLFSPEEHPNMPKEVLGSIVSDIDERVSRVVETIIQANKTPIIIGGGHNNAFGNLKGLALAYNKPINVINIDAHTDLRTLTYRHSGNGFTTALQGDADKGSYLSKYAMYGIHKNYTPAYIFEFIQKEPNRFLVHLFEDIQSYIDLEKTYTDTLKFVDNDWFGLEVDCDAIMNFPSSAQSPVGFELETVRQLIARTSQNTNCKYLHLCEASPSTEEEGQVGKALCYLATTFMQSR